MDTSGRFCKARDRSYKQVATTISMQPKPLRMGSLINVEIRKSLKNVLGISGAQTRAGRLNFVFSFILIFGKCQLERRQICHSDIHPSPIIYCKVTKKPLAVRNY